MRQRHSRGRAQQPHSACLTRVEATKNFKGQIKILKKKSFSHKKKASFPSKDSCKFVATHLTSMKFSLMLMVVAIQCTSSTFITSGVHLFVRVHHMSGCLHTTRPVSFRTSNSFPFFLGGLIARVCGSYIPIASHKNREEEGRH
jgi:hypothetical protein